MSLLGPSLHRLATPATCDHCVYKPSAPVPTVPLYFWMPSLGERGVLAHSLVGSAVSVACRVPVRSRHKLLGDRASLCGSIYGGSAGPTAVKLCVPWDLCLGLMFTVAASALPPLPRLSWWSVISASHSQEKPTLPRHTNSQGTSTALIHSLSKVELAQTEKEVAQAVHGFGYADPTGQAGWGNYHRPPGRCRAGIHAPCPMGTLESYDGEEGCRVHGGTTAERQVQTLNPNPWLT